MSCNHFHLNKWNFSKNFMHLFSEKALFHLRIHSYLHLLATPPNLNKWGRNVGCNNILPRGQNPAENTLCHFNPWKEFFLIFFAFFLQKINFGVLILLSVCWGRYNNLALFIPRIFYTKVNAKLRIITTTTYWSAKFSWLSHPSNIKTC